MSLSGPYLYCSLWGFEINWHICSPSLDGVSRERIASISQRSRSHMSSKVKNSHSWACPGHYYVVHCGILKSIGTFVNHYWTVCCAIKLRRYLQGQGHTLSSKIKNGHKWACPGHNYVVHCEILKSFGTFVHHHWMVCRTKELRRYLQGQGHTFSSKVKNGP